MSTTKKNKKIKILSSTPQKNIKNHTGPRIFQPKKGRRKLIRKRLKNLITKMEFNNTVLDFFSVAFST
jgi:hypothetical protein